MHGARDPGGLYLVDQLSALASAHDNVAYSACVLEGASAGMTQGSLDDVVFGRFPNLGGHKVFLCGDPVLVQKMKRRAFLAGMQAFGILRGLWSPCPARRA